MYCDKIDLIAATDSVKSKNSKECIVCYYWYFNHGFKFQNFICNGCNDLTILRLNLSYIATTTTIILTI